MPNEQPLLMIIQGMRGRGKTNLCKSYTSEMEPLYIVDIRNEYKHIPAFTNLSDFKTYILSRQYILDKGNIKKEQFRFTFRSQKELSILLELFAYFRNCTVVIDEADALCSMKLLASSIINLTMGSRNQNISLIFIGKRPFLIPIFIRSQCDQFIIFQVEESRDIKYLENRLRLNFPKQAYQLTTGEAIICKSGEKPELKKFPLFKEEIKK